MRPPLDSSTRWLIGAVAVALVSSALLVRRVLADRRGDAYAQGYIDGLMHKRGGEIQQ